MSDLAPFVAAALRDKVIQELTKENKSQAGAIATLKSSVRDLRSVSITGPGGTPVYSKWKLTINSITPDALGMHNTRSSLLGPMYSMSAKDLLTTEIQLVGNTYHLCDFIAQGFGRHVILRPVDNPYMRVLATLSSSTVEFLPSQLSEHVSVRELFKNIQESSQPTINIYLDRIDASPSFLLKCLSSKLSELDDGVNSIKSSDSNQHRVGETSNLLPEMRHL